MDPDRSGKFYIGEAKARTRIVQHFLRYIHEYSVPNPPDMVTHCKYSFSLFRMNFRLTALPGDELALNLRNHLTACFPTRDLFADFFHFDVIKWTSAMLVDGFGPDEDYHGHNHFLCFKNIFDLRAWFQKQVCFPNTLNVPLLKIVEEGRKCTELFWSWNQSIFSSFSLLRDGFEYAVRRRHPLPLQKQKRNYPHSASSFSRWIV